MDAQQQQEELKTLQEKYQARAEALGAELGVRLSETAKQETSALPFVRSRDSAGTQPSDACLVRVLQWNILAGGLSNDGFLVRNILRETSDKDFQTVVEQVVKARENGEDMQVLKEKLASPESSVNHSIVLDWSLRWTRMQLYIAVAVPDIITMQEMDHMCQAEQDLGRLGYDCALPGRRYCAAHDNMENYMSNRADPPTFFKHLTQTGAAFVPKTNSQCRLLGGGDDDGVAVFWRRDVFEVARVEFLVYEDAKRNQGAVRVRLRHRAKGTEMSVICAHLNSGSSAKDEQKRLHQWCDGSLSQDGGRTGPSLKEWFTESAESIPTLCCMDSNSAPGQQFELWKELCCLSAEGADNLWTGYYDAEGRNTEAPAPVTTNKMRGPLSGQPKKIGEHACGAIDNIVFSKHLAVAQFAWKPLTYATEEEALEDLLPSLNVPSDHMPVIVDFKLDV
uniref:Nocturnin n=1 Tax=Pyramimonas obovata TaxID=1411642 RepID=A0A7S0QW63_9CHLO|mmetsp:Transcript_15172/g.32680  ORF Transcript_15172/g.32680 Transcript_15172/m.32680 type:complete len:450 (+) Transcript_15172:201-1550(+)|eukprot:CAMPEP_0118924776 /NCGR_PEP_ID=MMETSP1169-20130426/2752_1 /TAXON_ID=36882 /ORGANISM="Pyramimonas obovata, Strain CCMP722" /LENGTH=449 /DNA_ID=CAMNT_0006865907 /DNA_START=196 /DNA_END=1545 /DNA_ORIENTATION=+